MARYLITGVRRGIGAEVARRLTDAGDRVYGVLRPGTPDPDALGLAGYGFADLADPDSVAAAVAPLADELADGLDGLVHSAGIADGTPLADTPPAVLVAQFTVNVTAVAALDRVFLPALRRSAGTVVYVNSGSGLVGRVPGGAYAASKHALRGYVDSIRAEEEARPTPPGAAVPGVRFSSVYPGRAATDMQRELNATEGREYRPENYLRAETVAEVIIGVIRLPADGMITDLTLRTR